MTQYDPTIDESIEAVAYEFARELMRLRQRMDWPSYSSQQLTLRISEADGKATAEICANVGGSYNSQVIVKGAQLGSVMDEVYRRLNYEDKAQGQIESSLQRLPSADASTADS